MKSLSEFVKEEAGVRIVRWPATAVSPETFAIYGPHERNHLTRSRKQAEKLFARWIRAEKARGEK
jgi:hypothetical protein